jgi:hypothetical protein
MPDHIEEDNYPMENRNSPNGNTADHDQKDTDEV